jgi:hypothetical protein
MTCGLGIKRDDLSAKQTSHFMQTISRISRAVLVPLFSEQSGLMWVRWRVIPVQPDGLKKCKIQ